MTYSRKSALAVGVLFILTFITSIGAVFAYGPVLSAGYITGAGADSGVYFGAFLELMLIVTNIACATVLFPILKRQNEALALAYVAERVIEGTFILIGLLSLLAIVTLRQQATGADGATLVTIGRTLRSIHDWTFLLGPSFADGIGTGAILGYLMYKSGLVGRRMALFGLVGGPLLVAVAVAVLLGILPQGSPVQNISTAPEFIWELFLGLYLTFKGFKASPVLAPANRERESTREYATAA
jgi:hypothetical protein